jgi:TOBE domain
VPARITDVVFLGNALKIVARLPSGETLSARDPDVRRHASYAREATESFSWALADQRILDGAQ